MGRPTGIVVSGDRLESSKALTESFAQIGYDANIWVEIKNAFWSGETKTLERLMETMIRDESQGAVNAWLALDPRNNLEAPTTPFGMEEYTNAAEEKALRLESEAEAKFQDRVGAVLCRHCHQFQCLECSLRVTRTCECIPDRRHHPLVETPFAMTAIWPAPTAGQQLPPLHLQQHYKCRE